MNKLQRAQAALALHEKFISIPNLMRTIMSAMWLGEASCILSQLDDLFWLDFVNKDEERVLLIEVTNQDISVIAKLPDMIETAMFIGECLKAKVLDANDIQIGDYT